MVKDDIFIKVKFLNGALSDMLMLLFMLYDFDIECVISQ